LSEKVADLKEGKSMSFESIVAKLIVATPDKLAMIDGVLDGKVSQEPVSVKLYTISAAARKTGMSRATIGRMLKGGSIRTVQIRANAKRIAESELVRIARGEPIK